MCVHGVHWKDWCWSWNSNTLAAWCEELTHLKKPWCWERLRAGREGDDRGWDGWMASPTRWTWFWVYSGSWWCTGRPGELQFMGLQRVRHDWVTELNWTSNEYSGLILIDCCDLFAIQGALKSLLQHHSSKASTTVQKHQFFSAQLSLWSNFHIHTWLLKKP